ncbi:MAG TPA: serine/threonine-protein kinase, partial [Chroococcales cyanobacterium]
MEKERYREEKIGISEGGAKSAPGRDVSIQAGADVELFISDTTLNNMFEKTDEELAAGTFIGSVYEVVSSLGSGGMSHIYLCRDIGLNRMVAVKLLRSANAGKQAIMRLQTEGRAVARLKHPNIVNLFGLQLTESGQPFLVMEVVNGISLAALLKTQGPLPVFKLLKYINQICEALEHAHKNGVIHRDLKPSNIMVVNAGSQNEQIKILDFGIAKVLNDDAGQINATQTGEIFGTPGYMSPEQAQGKRIDERSDQYSLGCVIFELLTGVPPFKRDSQLAVLMAHAQEKPPSLSQASGKQFSAELEAAIARMLAKDPADRFATIDDAGKAIAGMFAAEGGWRRYLVPAAAVAAALILSAASIGFVLQQPKPLVREPAAATEIGLSNNNLSQPVKEGKPEDASTSDFSLLMDLKAGRLRDIVNLPDAEITNRG